ncbi:type IV pilin protein [Cupriavidus sp. Agwp_2]
MTEAAQQLERFRSVNGRYDQDTAEAAFALPAAFRTSPRDSNRVRYNISLVANSLTANGYVLQAVPVDAADACGTYLLDQAGTRLNAVGANPAAYRQDCWER